jgi:hypothetical protein
MIDFETEVYGANKAEPLIGRYLCDVDATTYDVKYYFIISVIFTDPFGIFTNKGGLSI